MLRLDTPLPPGALCEGGPDPAGPLAQALWWHGSAGQMAFDPETRTVTRWTPVGPGPAARPTPPSADQTLLAEIGGLVGLQCRAGTHCGMVAEGALPATARFTLALRYYVPPGRAGLTLATLNTDAGRYLFLSETDGTLTLKDNEGRAECTAATAPGSDTAQMAIVSVDGPDIALDTGTETARATAPTGPALTGPASLYIGCRNHRPGLLKTLGAALILDVILLPDRALLQHPDDALTSLRRHHLWAGD